MLKDFSIPFSVNGDKKNNKFLLCTNILSGNTERVSMEGVIVNRMEDDGSQGSLPTLYSAPGLVDLQINGINGIDFNSPELTGENLLEATKYLLSKGVTTFYPTVITNATDEINKILSVIDEACKNNSLIAACINGIHLEGPFISPDRGFRGAHAEKFIIPPDWELFCEFQKSAGGRIKIITLAPEYKAAAEFIEQCTKQNILVSIGHSAADAEDIAKAITAGAKMYTHLGNGVPPMLARHNNILWEMLARDELFASIIADGIHLPDSFLKTVITVKKNKSLLVSDATMFAGMPAGAYTTHIGGEVILDNNGRLCMKESPDLLAGAAKDLLQCVQVLVNKKIVSLKDAWSMASVNYLELSENKQMEGGDWILFSLPEGVITIQCVIKNEQIVYART